MSGLIEDIISRRFGPPMTAHFQTLAARTWNLDDEPRRCKLYIGLEWDPELSKAHKHLSCLYGDSFGGILLQDSLRISTLVRQEVWGLYRIDDLHCRPEVQRALSFEPAVDYFMDAANVWYFGYKAGELLCYDSENDDIENLGNVEAAIDGLISQWLEAKRTC